MAATYASQGCQIGYYAGSLLMSEEMDAAADQRLDGRYAVDFPLPEGGEAAQSAPQEVRPRDR
eukprot:COSAG05_NODE_1205_length_5533_cov_1.927862_2_plen_63_part_00